MRARHRIAAALLALATLCATAAQGRPHFLASAARGAGDASDRPPGQPVPLPALPLPAGARVTAFCDSHSGFNNLAANAGLLAAPATAKGLIEAAWEADPRFNFDSWYDAGDPWQRATNGSTGVNINGANQGIPSDHFRHGSVAGGGAMQRLRYVLTRAPNVMVLNCGTNSISTGDTAGSSNPASAAYVESQLDAILATNMQHGVWTILSTLYPRGDWPSGDRRHQITRDVNDWIRAQANRAGVAAILDPYEALVSPTDPDGVRPSLFLDQVHLAPGGIALVDRDYLLPIMQRIVAPGSVFDQNPANANLFPAATYGLTGTGGTKAGATGAVASGFTLKLSRSGGHSTLAGAKDNGDPGLNAQIITVTPGGAAAWDQAQMLFPALPVTTATVPAGSWLRAYVRIEATDPASAGNILLTVTAADGGGTAKLSAQAGTVDSSVYNGASAAAQAGRGVYWLATKPFQMPADGNVASIAASITINWWAAAYGAAGGATPFTVKVSQPILRLSPDPRPAWNLP